MPLDSGTAAIVRRLPALRSSGPVLAAASLPVMAVNLSPAAHTLGRPASAPAPLVHFGLATTTPDGWLSLPAPSKAVTRYQYVTLLVTLVSL